MMNAEKRERGFRQVVRTEGRYAMRSRHRIQMRVSARVEVVHGPGAAEIGNIEREGRAIMEVYSTVQTPMPKPIRIVVNPTIRAPMPSPLIPRSETPARRKPAPALATVIGVCPGSSLFTEPT